MNECNPVTSPIRTAPALWRGAAPSVNCERRSAAAARNWSASWKAAARHETASPKTPGNYPNWRLTDPPQVTVMHWRPGGTSRSSSPPFSSVAGVLTKNKRRDAFCFAGGEVVWLFKLCLHMKWWRELLLARSRLFFFPIALVYLSVLTLPPYSVWLFFIV